MSQQTTPGPQSDGRSQRTPRRPPETWREVRQEANRHAIRAANFGIIVVFAFVVYSIPLIIDYGLTLLIVALHEQPDATKYPLLALIVELIHQAVILLPMTGALLHAGIAVRGQIMIDRRLAREIEEAL